MRTLPTFDLTKLAPPECSAEEALPWNVRCQKTDDTIEIMIDEEIGDDGWGGGIASSDVKAILQANPISPVNVSINSPGGQVYEGFRIYNLLVSHEGEVTTVNEGLAYSAASIIFLAGDVRRMHALSNFGIHAVQGGGWGTAELVFGLAEYIDNLDTMAIELYSQISGQSAEQVTSWMKARGNLGTMFGGDEAVEMGFATEVIDNRSKPQPTNQAEAVTQAADDRVKQYQQRAREVAIQARRDQINTLLGRVGDSK